MVTNVIFIEYLDYMKNFEQIHIYHQLCRYSIQLSTNKHFQYGPERECQTGDELAYMISFTNLDGSKKFENMSRERQIKFFVGILKYLLRTSPENVGLGQ